MTHTSSRPGKFRTVVAAVGAAAVLVAGAGVAAEAAGTAKSVLLGKNNKAKKTTKITIKKSKPALALKTKGGPAFSVNTNSLIPNLNADLLDGKSLEQISPTKYVMTVGTSGSTNNSGSQFVGTTALPAGLYEMRMGGIVEDTDEIVTCFFVDYTKLLASDVTGYYFVKSLDETITGGLDVDLGSNTIGDVVAGHQLIFGCAWGAAGTLVARAPHVVLNRVDPPTTAPGTAPVTPRPGRSPLGGRSSLR
jgi:hypothetical protein